MKIASKSLFPLVLTTSSCFVLFCILVAIFSSSSTPSKNLVHSQRRGPPGGGGGMRMPFGQPSTAEDADDPHLYRKMPGRDHFGGDGGDDSFMGGMPGAGGGGRGGARMPDRFMGGGSFESRAYSAESAGDRPTPGGMGDGFDQGPGVVPENEYDREEARKNRDQNGMGGWAKTKRPGVKVDTEFRDRMRQFENTPFMQEQKRGRSSRHAEDAFPNDITGGGERNLRRKRPEKPKKKKSKVPAKPGHANPRSNSRYHYTRSGGDQYDGEIPAGAARGQYCFKKASSTCSVRVMQENFAAYTRCIFDNRKRFGKDCEDWAGAQGACAADMSAKCPKQDPAKTTRCLKEKNSQGEVSNACRDSDFFKSLEQGFGKFEENYDAAGGDNVFDSDPDEFNTNMGGGGGGKNGGDGGQGGMPNMQDFMNNAFNDAKDSFSADDMEKIKKAAMESVMKEEGASGGEFDGQFPGPGGAGGQQQNAQSIPRERQLGGNEKMSKVDDL